MELLPSIFSVSVCVCFGAKHLPLHRLAAYPLLPRPSKNVFKKCPSMKRTSVKQVCAIVCLHFCLTPLELSSLTPTLREQRQFPRSRKFGFGKGPS